jgi:hypothetical protein
MIPRHIVRTASRRLLFLGLLCALCAPARAQDTVAREYAVKAAFLVNFAEFVGWPADARETDEPVTIGVIGGDPFGGALDGIVAKKNANGRRYVVRRCKDLDDVEACHILFVTNTDAERTREIVRGLLERPVLTVGETKEFAQCGGIVRFFVHEDRVRFEINEAAARRARLKLSAKLLRLQKKAPR